MKELLALPHNPPRSATGAPRNEVATFRHPINTRGQAVQGAVWFAPEFRELLVRNGLSEFEPFMNPSVGVRLRQVADRENWRLELVDADGRKQAFYLKVHCQRTWQTRLAAWLGRSISDSPGFNEAAGACWLDRCGVGTMRVAAWGEQLTRDGWLRSFVLTEELTGYTQLDHYLQRFDAGNPRQREALRRLMQAVARAARQFHQLGCNHRDFYSCHFFVRHNAGDYDVRLIDLQRCQQRRRFRGRWLVKDLAQLSYSTCGQRASNRLRLAFYKAYRGTQRLGAADKRFIRRVLAKQRQMTRRLGEY